MNMVVRLVLVAGLPALTAFGGLGRTDWFRAAGYGIMVHYLADAEVSVTRVDDIHSDCAGRTWDACVEAFDVERFAREAERMGAGYVLFTLLQGSRFVAAPNAEYDAWFGFRPGEACARRDLPMELADALARHGIPLMLYFTGDGPVRDPACRARGGFAAPIPMAWVERWARVLECFAVRYGAKVKGWWIDGCYVKNGGYGYTPEMLRKYEQAIRKGNQEALVAFNRAEDIEKPVVDPYVPFQDYTAGEKNGFSCLPQNGWLVDGQQWHVLTHLGSWWGRPGIKKQTRELAEYLYLVNRRGGVVTIDVMCYWDGGLERSQVNTLAGVRPALARMKETAARNRGNLAFLRPTRCLSLRGTPLPMQRECRESLLAATDGDDATFIRGCMEWPWQLEVDLEDVREFRQVDVHYRTGNYATYVRLSVSPDGQEWRTLAEQENANSDRTELKFPVVNARFVRFAALKPDGEGQPGEQMAIAEIDIR